VGLNGWWTNATTVREYVMDNPADNYPVVGDKIEYSWFANEAEARNALSSLGKIIRVNQVNRVGVIRQVDMLEGKTIIYVALEPLAAHSLFNEERWIFECEAPNQFPNWHKIDLQPIR